MSRETADAALEAWLARLDAPVSSLPGIGPKRASNLLQRFQRDVTLRDLLLVPPSDVLALEATLLEADRAGLPTVLRFRAEGVVQRERSGRSRWRLRGWADDTPLDLLWFRSPPKSVERQLAADSSALIAGIPVMGRGWTMSHPRLLSEKNKNKAAVRYPALTNALSGTIQTVIKAFLDDCPTPGEPLVAALAQIHAVDLVPAEQRETARRTLAAAEWRVWAGDLATQHEPTRSYGAPPIRAARRLEAALRGRLGFLPTPSQEAALSEIRADLVSSHRMVRLVFGDVGSGKTLVAAMALADCIEAGFAGALMAPSEMLARQHAETLDHWLRPLGVETVLLTGSIEGGGRALVRRHLQSGHVHLVVGTHALLYGAAPLPQLGLVVIDEQHRFGVGQRQTLAERAGPAHVLMLSATPIPRSLSLAILGKLPVSHLQPREDAMRNVATRLIPRRRLPEVVSRLVAVVQTGARAFWICPTVSADPETSAKARFQQLTERAPGKVALVTGRMPADPRNRELEAFAAGEKPILVATTVVEVGIHVPDAGIMVIEGAERFGLAQLHQLRGRVGRDGQEASCVLLYDEPLSQGQRQRLSLLRTIDDGAALAEADLQVRGPGDWLGRRQAGELPLRIARLPQDLDLLPEAIATADRPLAPFERRLFRSVEEDRAQEPPAVLAAG